MVLEQLIQIYAALLVVITLHELGHFPKKIRFKWGPIPFAAAMQARSRLGGLFVNVLIFGLVFYFRPENVFLQYMGLIAWAHFILYAVLGSIIPEANPKRVNLKTHIFDDVPNEYGALFIGAALAVLYFMNSYYVPIFSGVFI